jgi:hypothetical protein
VVVAKVPTGAVALAAEGTLVVVEKGDKAGRRAS